MFPVVLFALVLALLSACASSGKSSGGGLTAVEDLPPAYRDTWRAFAENSEAWPELETQILADPGLANFMVDNLLRVMVKSYDRAQLARAGDLPGSFERSRRELVHLAPYSAPVCIELMMVGDGVVAFLTADVILRIDDPIWTLPVAEKLTEVDPRRRQRAVELLAKLPHALDDEPRVWDLLERAVLEDPEWIVRAQAATAVGARAQLATNLTRPREILCRALRDEVPTVPRVALEALAETDDPAAIPAVIDFLEREQRSGTNLATFRAAQACLLALSGEQTPRDAAAWRAWWREHHR